MKRVRPRNRRLDDRPPALRCLAFAAFLVAYAFGLQFCAAGLGSVDGYFHVRYSALLREAGLRGFPPEFPWLPLTILSADRYYDHHMLFHVWLAAFVGEDPVLGGKLASAVGASFAFVSLYAVLVWQRVQRAEWWTVAALGVAPAFAYRMEMPRVQAWSVVFLLLAQALLQRRRSVWLLPLALTYTWLYDAFPLLLVMCGCAALADWVSRRVLLWQPLAYAGAGVLVGLLVNPYFPHNVRFIAHHYLAKLEPGSRVPVGAEWAPLAVADWLGWGGLAVILGTSAFLLHRYRSRVGYERLLAATTALFFLVLSWRANRFVEYLVPFGAVALAMGLHAPLAHLVHRTSAGRRRLLAAAVLAAFSVTSVFAARQLRTRPPASRYAAASRWIAANTPPDSIVFASDWDDFPLLFFHNTENRYVLGLDPTYLAERSPPLYELWGRIADGEEARPAALLREELGAVAALTDRAHEAFVATMDADPQARRAYEDEDAIVYLLSGTSRQPG